MRHTPLFWAVTVLLAGLGQLGCGKGAEVLLNSAPETIPIPPKTFVAPAITLPSDSVVRAIYDEIVAKANAVQSYTCTWEGRETERIAEGPRAGELVELIHAEERSFKRPELLRVKITQVKHSGIPSREGLMWEQVVDGQYSWHYNLASPEEVVQSALLRVNAASGPASREAMVRRTHSASLFRLEIAPLRAAGVWGARTWPQLETLLMPFIYCKLESLALEAETAETWQLSSEPRAEYAAEMGTLRLTFGKGDGMLQEMRIVKPGGENVQRVSNLVLNPVLADELFQFEAPAGIEVNDTTESELGQAF